MADYGIKRRLIDIMLDHTGDTMTIERLRKLSGYTTSQISGTLSTLCSDFPDEYEKLGRGVYRRTGKAFSTNPKVSDVEQMAFPTERIEQVITVSLLATTDDGRTIGRSENGTLYIMEPI